jgi:hypothetical protein
MANRGTGLGAGFRNGQALSTRSRVVRLLAFAVISMAALARPGSAAAQADACLTKPEKIAATLTAKDASELARAEATKLSADSALISIMSTPPGVVDAEGRTPNWMFQFFSVSTKKLLVVHFSAGEMICSPTVTDGTVNPVVIGETAETILDSARVLNIAREAAGPSFDPALTVSLNLRRGESGEAYWVVSYANPEGRPMFSIMVDSKTGAATKRPG